MNGHWVDIKAHDGGSFGAYVSTPPKVATAPNGQGPGIVLIQEIWGVNQHIRDVADSYALDLAIADFDHEKHGGVDRAVLLHAD